VKISWFTVFTTEDRGVLLVEVTAIGDIPLQTNIQLVLAIEKSQNVIRGGKFWNIHVSNGSVSDISIVDLFLQQMSEYEATRSDIS
jgi:hypothetical protein